MRRIKEVGIRGSYFRKRQDGLPPPHEGRGDGVVASPREIGIIRERCGDKFRIVTPGIRLPTEKKDDQKRTLSPKEAISAGADYLVIGRPIKEAKDPLEAVQKIIDDISFRNPAL